MSGVRRLLNETALSELENVRISIHEPKRTMRKRKPKVIQEKIPGSDDIGKLSENDDNSHTTRTSDDSVQQENAPDKK